MPEPDSPAIALETHSVHHQASLLLDPTTNAIRGGAILNVSDHARVGLNLDQEGRTSGKITHFGKTHAFEAFADDQGNFAGMFEDKQAGVTITITGGIASLQAGQIPTTGLQIQGKHHTTTLQLDNTGQLTGTIEAQSLEGAAFRVEVNQGRVIGGSFVHRDDSHETQIRFQGDRWSATVKASRADKSWALSVERGKASLIAKAQMELEF
jgi:hypothetical protein